MKRLFILLYGIVCYVIFLVTVLYAVGFVGNFGVPRGIDSAPVDPTGQSIFINFLLLAIFAVQHSVMARPTFKKVWTKIIPVAAERSTYVLLTSAALLLLFRYWQPLGGVVWEVSNPAGRSLLWAGFALGWVLVIVSTFLINHFELFGLKQVWLNFKKREYTWDSFVTPGLYKYTRHPMYLGFIFAFWSTPTMTVSHMFFALATTVYIFVAVRLEERNLGEFLGEDYYEYKRQVPMIFPLGRKYKAPEKRQG